MNQLDSDFDKVESWMYLWSPYNSVITYNNTPNIQLKLLDDS